MTLNFRNADYFQSFQKITLALILGVIAFFLASAIFPSWTIHRFASASTEPELKPYLELFVDQLTQFQQQYFAITLIYLGVAILHAAGTVPLWLSYRKRPRTWKGILLHTNNVLSLTLLPLFAASTLIYIGIMLYLKYATSRPNTQPPLPKRTTTQSAFTLVELMGSISIVLVITLAITAAHRFTHSEAANLRALDQVSALNQAEQDLIDYAGNTAPNKPGADQPATDPDFTSNTPSVRAAFLLRHGFLSKAVDTTGLTVTTKQNRNFWVTQ